MSFAAADRPDMPSVMMCLDDIRNKRMTLEPMDKFRSRYLVDSQPTDVAEPSLVQVTCDGYRGFVLPFLQNGCHEYHWLIFRGAETTCFRYCDNSMRNSAAESAERRQHEPAARVTRARL